MLFTQIEFFVFLAAIVMAVLLVWNFSARKWILLGASYYFYAYWDWRFAGLLLLCTLVNFVAAACISRSESERVRRVWLAGALVYSLGVLCYFKYLGFFLDSFRDLFGLSDEAFGAIDILLPVGISFYTFQTLSYTIDVYRGGMKVCGRFTDFALFVAFFPQLVAGPIVRASEFLPQLETPVRMSWSRSYDGFQQFVKGLFKKVFIADRLAAFIDPAFENAEAFDGATLWLAAIAYAIQIYCDFSGYSDMAIGVARMLGFDLTKNFDHPYLAISIQDFWRRWHISLSSWLRDYLYIPLGGNRLGERRTYLNLMITMVLGGLWHGAAWTFVFWGAWHGLALSVDRWWNGRLRRDGNAMGRKGAVGGRALLGWAITLLFVLVGWVFFRSPDFHTALVFLRKMFLFEPGLSWLHPFALGAVVFVAGYHLIIALGRGDWLDLPSHSFRAPLILFTLVWLVIAFYPRGFQPFIYFQF